MIFQQAQNNWVECIGPYDAAFVKYLQSGIKPTSYRAYDTETRAWRFYYSLLPQVAQVARSRFQEVDWSTLPTEWQMYIVGGKKPDPIDIHRAVDKPVDKSPYAVLFVTPNAPMSVVQASYKVLAKTYHPDVSGDSTKMVELNQAMDEIRKDRSCG